MTSSLLLYFFLQPHFIPNFKRIWAFPSSYCCGSQNSLKMWSQIFLSLRTCLLTSMCQIQFKFSGVVVALAKNLPPNGNNGFKAAIIFCRTSPKEGENQTLRMFLAYTRRTELINVILLVGPFCINYTYIQDTQRQSTTPNLILLFWKRIHFVVTQYAMKAETALKSRYKFWTTHHPRIWKKKMQLYLFLGQKENFLILLSRK